jgi:hypothetical protein
VTTKPPRGFNRLQQRASRGDCEAAAAMLILDTAWARGKAEPFVDRDGIDFASMLSAHDAEDASEGICRTWLVDPGSCDCGPYWSSSEALLVRLAWNLWSAEKNSAINVAHLLDTCGDTMLGLALKAMDARCGGRLPMHHSDEHRPSPRSEANSSPAWTPVQALPEPCPQARRAPGL